MAMDSAVDELTQVIEHCRGFSNAKFPDAVIQPPMFDVTENVKGFGISPGRGLTMVMGDVTGMKPTQWSLQFASAIAVDVANIGAAANWVNERNRNTAIGKYYYALSGDGSLCAVLWECLVWSGLLLDLFADGPKGPRVQWLLHLLGECAHTASEESGNFVHSVAPGRLLGADQGDTYLLFGAMSA